MVQIEPDDDWREVVSNGWLLIVQDYSSGSEKEITMVAMSRQFRPFSSSSDRPDKVILMLFGLPRESVRTD
jgi:hypothetical protein